MSEYINYNETSIANLKQAEDIGINDYFLIQPQNFNNQAMILPYKNLIIGLDNVSFASTFTQHSTDIATLSNNITTLSSNVENLSNSKLKLPNGIILAFTEDVTYTINNAFEGEWMKLSTQPKVGDKVLYLYCKTSD